MSYNIRVISSRNMGGFSLLGPVREIRPMKEQHDITCRICHKPTGKKTWFLEEIWTECPKCKKEKQEAKKEIDDAEEKIAELNRHLDRITKYVCVLCGRKKDKTSHDRGHCPFCHGNLVIDDDCGYDRAYDRWSEAKDKRDELIKAFNEKF